MSPPTGHASTILIRVSQVYKGWNVTQRHHRCWNNSRFWVHHRTLLFRSLVLNVIKLFWVMFTKATKMIKDYIFLPRSPKCFYKNVITVISYFIVFWIIFPWNMCWDKILVVSIWLQKSIITSTSVHFSMSVFSHSCLINIQVWLMGYEPRTISVFRSTTPLQYSLSDLSSTFTIFINGNSASIIQATTSWSTLAANWSRSTIRSRATKTRNPKKTDAIETKPETGVFTKKFRRVSAQHVWLRRFDPKLR